MEPYLHSRDRKGWRWRAALFWTLLSFAAFLYGGMFALFPLAFIPPLLVPILLFSLSVIWALPHAGRAPTRLMYWLFLLFFGSLIVWPNYLAIAIPGLPWITLLRIIGIPLAMVMIISISISRNVRDQMKDIIRSTPVIWKLLVSFIVIQFISIFFSKNPLQSLDKFVIAQLYWTTIFFSACYVFRIHGRMTLWVILLIIMTVLVSAIGYWEWRIGRVPWAGHIPSFLQIEDENVQRILAGASRAATGIYRVQSTFTTSLGLAEFLALTTPFLIHLVIESRRWWIRAAALFFIPFIFFTIINTDARLGAMGFFLSFLLYIGLWGARRWLADRHSLLGPAVTLSYPILFSGFFVATMFVGRLRRMVWGGGEHQFSTQARLTQIDTGLPMIIQRPFGHGVGQAAEVLGFTNGMGVPTIDSYYLSIALEYGLIGFILYFGIFVAAVVYAVRSLMRARTDEEFYLLPLAVSLIVFLVIKSVFSQEAGHPLAFMMAGAVCALTFRVTRSNQELQTSAFVSGT